MFLVALLISGALAARLAGDEPTETLAPASAASRDYRISDRDMIQFQVYQEPDVLVVQRVTASGEIRLPLIGSVPVAGLTLREAEERLHRLYVDGGFYIDPQIILSVHAYTERSVSVLGQVNRPNQVEFPPESRSIGLVQAITHAGGLTRLAKADAIQVVRVDQEGQEERFTIDLNTYLGRRNAAPKPFELYPGDVVFVPERAF